MKMPMSLIRFITLTTALLGLSLLYATSAMAAEMIEGRLNGLECAAHGEQCPTDRLDPHIALERDFVVQVGDKYYFITNLDRAVKARHALKMVRVKGKMSKMFDAIQASELWVKEDGDYRLTWSLAMEAEERRRLFGTGPADGSVQ
ncbi:MAG: hypothetical protein MI754_15085 [Chromatiales bacterium]|nr:hypothetical protein [Chromatiales bacterium]